MSRQRPLKVYVASHYFGPEIMEALGAADAPFNNRTVGAFVAARSLREGAILLGTTPGSPDRLGGAKIYRGHSDDKHFQNIISKTMAKPGQVFLCYWRRSGGDDQIILEASVDLDHPRRLVVGRSGDLALGEALLAKKEADKAAAKAEDEQRRMEREERKAHREQTSRSIEEALDRLRPMLEALGINPQTVVEGHGVAPNHGRQGILLPAEAVERLVKMAVELDEVMGG